MVVLEAEFSPGMAPGESQQLAQLIEQAGFDRLGISDVVLWPDSFIVQSLCAQVTSHMQIGSMVSNPYTRHPVALAAAVATIDECSGGRAFLGLGVGAGLEDVGIATDRPVATMQRALETIRVLLDGGSVDADSPVARPVGATLRRRPTRRIPLAVGTRSPQVMRIAGELADTVLVGARYISPDVLDVYRRWVDLGAAAARRPKGTPEIAPRLTLCVSDDARAAYATMRRDAAEFLVTLQPEDLDVDPAVTKAIGEALSTSRGWYFDPEAYHPPELDELVDDGLVRRFAVCGSPEECLDQVRRVVELGVTALSFKLAPVRRPGMTMLEGLRETVTGFGRIADRVHAMAS